MKLKLIRSTFGTDREMQFLTSFLVNQNLLIDAGSAGFALSAEELAHISHIFISHAHMDHIASLPGLLDACLSSGLAAPVIWANAHTIGVLREMIFNNQVWPDFLSVTATDGQPLVQLREMVDFEPVKLDGVTVTPVPVNHVVPTHGFLLDSADATIVISSDTGPTEAIWAMATQQPRLDAVVLEVSFTNQMQSLAERACHLTPASFGRELIKIKGHRPKILAVHLKPWLRAEIIAELAELGLKEIEIMHPGLEYIFP